MEHDRWHWFAGGVVLGLLIGAGIAGSYGMTKYAEARAEAQDARERAEHWKGEAIELRARADKAEKDGR